MDWGGGGGGGGGGEWGSNSYIKKRPSQHEIGASKQFWVNRILKEGLGVRL